MKKEDARAEQGERRRARAAPAMQDEVDLGSVRVLYATSNLPLAINL